MLLNRLEDYAEQNGIFSSMQFGFKEGVGCTEASIIILETINHMLERGSKVFGCSGLTVYFISYFPNLKSEGTCGLPSETFVLV